jgi:hypothetical protein
MTLHLHFVLKILKTYLEAWYSYFQPNGAFKMFKNSGSGVYPGPYKAEL